MGFQEKIRRSSQNIEISSSCKIYTVLKQCYDRNILAIFLPQIVVILSVECLPLLSFFYLLPLLLPVKVSEPILDHFLPVVAVLLFLLMAPQILSPRLIDWKGFLGILVNFPE